MDAEPVYRHGARALEGTGVRVFLSHDPDDFAALPHDGESGD